MDKIVANFLSYKNLSDALKVAYRCFPNPEDQDFLREHWERVLKFKYTYFCQHDKKELTLLEHFVYKFDNNIVAFGGLYRHNTNKNSEWLNWFGVDPMHRGSSYGSQVIMHLADISTRRGIKTLLGYTEDTHENIATKNFYEKLGFKANSNFLFRNELVKVYELNLT